MANVNPSFGDQIGRYRLLGELARGGMGIVYVAVAHGPAGFTKLVALKELQPELVRDADFLTMFLEEARMAARLNHPNIVHTIDVSEADGRHFIAMEYLEGRSLYQILRRFTPKGGLPPRVALAMLRDALNALDYAHELKDADGRLLGFVHRDVSPHNIFVTYDGHAKVIDFGIAKARDSSLETKTGVLKGRTSYMAPEQLTHHADRRTDLFSVGAILFEVFANRRLWQGMGDIEILGRLMRSELPSLHTAQHVMPAPIWQICHTALNPRPDQRFSTAAEMREALDEYLWSTGGIPRPKEVADVLQAEFAVERQQARELIESAMQRLREGHSGRLEVLSISDPREGSHKSNGSLMRAAAATVLGSNSASGQRPVPPPPPPGALDEVLRFVGAQRKLIGAALLGFVLVATTLAVALHHSPPPVAAVEPATPASAPRPAVAVPPPTQVVASAPDTIELSVTVQPANGQLLLDGETLPSNPFLGRFPRSTAMHRVRAVATGYEARERLVSFADNVMVDFSLVPKTPPREAHHEWTPPPRHEAPHPVLSRPSPSVGRTPPPHAERAPSPPPIAPQLQPASPPPARSAPADITPKSGNEAPRRRAIDSNNPYGDQ